MTPIRKPTRCYFICMTPRSGSELLCEALAATGVAGTPTEHFWNFDGTDYPERFGVADYREALEHVYSLGTTPNGVFGVKFGIEGEFFRHVVRVVREALSLPAETAAADVIREGFPDLRIIALTRRNKVRQAVSWARAIQEDIWHVRHSRPAPPPSAEPVYDFRRIDHLIQDLVLREASHQDFLDAFPGPRPLTLVYEDLVKETDATVRRCLEYLGLEAPAALPARQDLVRQANATNEEWVGRYRIEKQAAWKQKAWVSFEPDEEPLENPEEPRAEDGFRLEILEVEKQRIPYRLVCGGHVDFPKPGTLWNCGVLHVSGWFLGKDGAAGAVEIVSDGGVLQRALPAGDRPDIAALFPGEPGAGASGFRIGVPGAALGPEFDLLVEGVLPDDTRIPLARIKGRLAGAGTPGASPLLRSE